MEEAWGSTTPRWKSVVPLSDPAEGDDVGSPTVPTKLWVCYKGLGSVGIKGGASCYQGRVQGNAGDMDDVRRNIIIGGNSALESVGELNLLTFSLVRITLFKTVCWCSLFIK